MKYPSLKNLYSRFNQAEDEFSWLISALFILLLSIFIHAWFFVLVIYGLILRTFGYRPKYFVIGPNVVKLPIGTVKDAITKQPIPLAIVRLHAKETNRLLQTRVTNGDGIYEFLLPQGSYFIEVNKNGYEFPSKLSKAGYIGQEINISRETKYSIFNETIYLDPKEATASQVNQTNASKENIQLQRRKKVYST